MQVKIVSKGHYIHTVVEVDGQLLEGVLSASWEITTPVGGKPLARATIVLENVELEAEGLEVVGETPRVAA